MSNEATAPTLDQFLAMARAEFAFLADHGFIEVPQVRAGDINPFTVLYRRGTQHLRIEGLSYGFSADLAVETRGVFCALCLKTFGAAFLKGDNAVLDELHRRARVHAQAVIQQSRDYWRHRDMEVAIAEAAAAFRAGRYSDVVGLLSAFESNLPRAQAMKLELARKRV